MKAVIFTLFAALLGGVAGYKIGSHGPEFKAGMYKAYGADIDRKEIAETLKNQASAWNAGDIDAFMQDYWNSEELRFASGGDINKSWDTTIARYKSRYPDKAAMGRLAFTDLDVKLLSETDALVFGRWELTRAQDRPNGLFTLHFRKFGEDWKIVSDHTSSAN